MEAATLRKISYTPAGTRRDARGQVYKDASGVRRAICRGVINCAPTLNREGRDRCYLIRMGAN